jgi:predicted ribosome quality control (RQC) complex YloA/Tae2 family protein
MLISTTKLDLSKQINSLVGLASDLESDSPEAKALAKKQERLKEAEKALDMQLQQYQNQLEMINQEEQSVKKEKSEAIQRAFA